MYSILVNLAGLESREIMAHMYQSRINIYLIIIMMLFIDQINQFLWLQEFPAPSNCCGILMTERTVHIL